MNISNSFYLLTLFFFLQKILEKEFDKLLTDLADTDFIHVSGKGMNDKMIRKRHSE
jgi:hypothetical protein